MLPRPGRKSAEGLTVSDGLGVLAKHIRPADGVPFLGQHDDVRAGGRGTRDQLLRLLEVGGLLGAGVQLHARHTEQVGQRPKDSPGPVADACPGG